MPQYWKRGSWLVKSKNMNTETIKAYESELRHIIQFSPVPFCEGRAAMLLRKCVNDLLNEIQRRQLLIKSEPDGIVRETMINNLLLDFPQPPTNNIE
jgi:hypothetical protein